MAQLPQGQLYFKSDRCDGDICEIVGDGTNPCLSRVQAEFGPYICRKHPSAERPDHGWAYLTSRELAQVNLGRLSDDQFARVIQILNMRLTVEEMDAIIAPQAQPEDTEPEDAEPEQAQREQAQPEEAETDPAQPDELEETRQSLQNTGIDESVLAGATPDPSHAE